MKRRVMLLESLDSFAAKTNKDEPDQKIERMKKIMRIGIETELTKRQYDCLTMRYFEDKKVGEIADILFITPATVYKHLNKAIKRLRKCEKYL